MNERIKEWIDGASYEQLLSKWRYSPIGDPMLQGEAGEYYSKIMFQKKSTVNHVQASKNVGWDH